MHNNDDIVTVELKKDYLTELARDFNKIYDQFYEEGGDTGELVELGDKMLKNNHPAATMLIFARHDIITSDREAATLAELAKRRGWI